MNLMLLFLAVATLLSAQSNTGAAGTKGPCSPANTGNNNTFNITCQGISEKLGSQIVELLNRLAKNESDAQMILSKLDGCVQGVEQVREQQVPWRMTNDQRTKLQALVAGHHGSIEIHIIPSDSNAALFGKDLLDAFQQYDSGPYQGVSMDFGLKQDLQGVAVVVTDPNIPDAEFLRHALSIALGFEVPGYITEKTGTKRDSIVVIAVGAKPKSAR